jgi:hypothetical protein
MCGGFSMIGKKANDVQFGGSHYQTPIQPWDYIIANEIGYLEGTAIKYLSRWKRKNGLEDLYKARHFIEKLIETEEEKKKNACRTSNNVTKLSEKDLVPDPNSNFSWEQPVVLWEHEV